MSMLLIAGIVFCYICISLKHDILVPFSNCLWPTLCFAISLPYFIGKLISWLENESIYLLSRILAFYGAMSLELYCLQEIVGKHLIPILKNIPGVIVNVIMISLITLFAYILLIIEKRVVKINTLPRQG